MIDVNILRQQFKVQVTNFKRLKSERLRIANLNSAEYFNEGENADDDVSDVEIFGSVENTDQFSDDNTGKILVTQYNCAADYEQDIKASDFIVLNSKDVYKVVNLNKILHPITSETIGLTFSLVYSNSVDNYRAY